MGKNKIRQFLSSATENVQITKSGKISNHSVCKTCINTLLNSGVSHNTVTQLSDHKNLKSLISCSATWNVKNCEWSCSEHDEIAKVIWCWRSFHQGNADPGLVLWSSDWCYKHSKSGPSRCKGSFWIKSWVQQKETATSYHWVLRRRELTSNKLLLFDDTLCEEPIVRLSSFIH